MRSKKKTKKKTKNNVINVLTYNMSWATQINKTLGSESDFVEACQEKYPDGGITCNENAIKKLKSLDNIRLMGIQEVNSEIEKKIKKNLPQLDKYKRGKVGLSTVSIMWDSNTFGNLKSYLLFNLSSTDDRPCLILLTKKNNKKFILMNIHAPWRMEGLKESLSKNISSCNKKLIKKAFRDKDIKIIVLGDFNDDKGLLNINNPLNFIVDKEKISVGHIKNKSQLNKSLKSCCWHKNGHEYGYFIGPGDYILINSNLNQLELYIPKEFNSNLRSKNLYSDHKPVISKIII